MNYEVYGVDGKNYEQIVPLVQQLNAVIKKLFDKESKDRLGLIREKGKLKEAIFQVLEGQSYLGILEEEEIKTINLTQHLLSQKEIEEILMNLEDTSTAGYQLLKKAVVKEQNICLWVK